MIHYYCCNFNFIWFHLIWSNYFLTAWFSLNFSHLCRSEIWPFPEFFNFSCKAILKIFQNIYHVLICFAILLKLFFCLVSFLKSISDFTKFWTFAIFFFSLKKLRSLTHLPGNCLLCTMDVVGLYPNIPHDEGLSALRKRLNERDKKDVSTDTLVELAELVLKNNIFNFNERTLKQKKRHNNWDKVCSAL